jgi:hypothetical protein
MIPSSASSTLTTPRGIRAVDLPALARVVAGSIHSNGSQTARYPNPSSSTTNIRALSPESRLPSSLFELVLCDNPLGDVAITAIAESQAAVGAGALRWLHTLYLSGNALGHKGALMIADALQRQHSIRHLVSFASVNNQSFGDTIAHRL